MCPQCLGNVNKRILMHCFVLAILNKHQVSVLAVKMTERNGEMDVSLFGGQLNMCAIRKSLLEYPLHGQDIWESKGMLNPAFKVESV